MMQTASNTETISTLASQLEQHASSTLPPSVFMYRAGGIIYRECLSSSSQTSSDAGYTLLQHFREFSISFPSNSLKSILMELNAVFIDLVMSRHKKKKKKGGSSNNGDDSIMEALQSLCGIYKSSPICCKLGYSNDIMDALNTLFGAFSVQQHQQKQLNKQTSNGSHSNNNNEDSEGSKLICRITSQLLLHGLLSSDITNDEEELNHVLQIFTKLSDDDDGGALEGRSSLLGKVQYFQTHEEQSNEDSNSTLFNYTRIKFPRSSTERDYVLDILKSSLASADAAAAPYAKSTATTTTTNDVVGRDKSGIIHKHQSTTTPAMDGMQLLINQITSILPNLGEGYIETALQCYNLDTETTLSALLDDTGSTLHPRLQSIDPNLPRIQSKHSNESSLIKEESSAKERTRELVKEMEAQAENEAFLLSQMNMYGDDYDDQYDDHGDAPAAAQDNNNGMYDNGGASDYDAVKNYNKLARGVESDSAFWEENRNLNRQAKKGGKQQNRSKSPKPPSKNNNGEEEEDTSGNEGQQKKWGPDKGKGGRAIGPDGKYLPFKKRGKKGAPANGSNQNVNAAAAGGGGGGGNNNNNQQQSQKPKPKKGGGGGGSKKTNPSTSSSDSKPTKNGDTKSKNGDKSKSGDPQKQTDLTKIQKRRKNDNKSKIGNHHRKERALKKSGGAM